MEINFNTLHDCIRLLAATQLIDFYVELNKSIDKKY